jgi:vacuolar iron transporter family protein
MISEETLAKNRRAHYSRKDILKQIARAEVSRGSGGQVMTIASILSDLKRSLVETAGTIVFGMEDGTVSIFGLIFGVAATTTSSHAVLIAGSAGAAAAAVSMMAGAYLDAETSRDETKANRASLPANSMPTAATVDALLSTRQAAGGLTPRLSAALAGAVRNDPEALKGLVFALQAPPTVQQRPWEQALWMLVADFLSAAVPILPFVFFPIPQARFVSAVVTTALLIALGVGRARIAKRGVISTVVETVSIGIAAALAGVSISVLIDRGFGA